VGHLREDFEELCKLQLRATIAAKEADDFHKDLEVRANSHFNDCWERQFSGFTCELLTTAFKMNFDTSQWAPAINLYSVSGKYYEEGVGWYEFTSNLRKVPCNPPIRMEDLKKFLIMMEKETGIRFSL